MRLAPARLAILVASTGTVALSSPAIAQEQQVPTVKVESIHVPATIGKLTTRGIRVTAGCSASCLLLVKVKVPPSVAARLGLTKRVIATGVGEAAAGELRTIRAKVRAKTAARLADYEGSKGLKIRVRALP